MEPGPSLGELLTPFDPDTLRDDTSTICACAPDLRIVFVNRAWSDFAGANGAGEGNAGCGVGASLLDVTPPVLRPFYEDFFARAGRPGAAVEHDYECSSSTTARRFRMRAVACASGALLVVHSLLREAPVTARASAAVDALYRSADGIVMQCSHCRRVRRVGLGRQWEWVPAFVERMPAGTSHGLCELCDAFYYSV